MNEEQNKDLQRASSEENVDAEITKDDFEDARDISVSKTDLCDKLWVLANQMVRASERWHNEEIMRLGSKIGDIKFMCTRFAHQCRLKGVTTNDDTCNLFDEWIKTQSFTHQSSKQFSLEDIKEAVKETIELVVNRDTFNVVDVQDAVINSIESFTPKEHSEGELKEIKFGEVFIVEGKKYMVTIPKSPLHLDLTNEHGHIIHELKQID